MWLASIQGRVAARFGGRQDADSSELSSAGGKAPVRSRALVPVTPVKRTQETTPALARPLAPFLAQLIATKQDAPQTRARRRAGFGEAVAEYAGCEAAAHSEPPRQHAIRSI